MAPSLRHRPELGVRLGVRPAVTSHDPLFRNFHGAADILIFIYAMVVRRAPSQKRFFTEPDAPP